MKRKIKKDVLVFFGSPKKYGNTGKLLNSIICENKKQFNFHIISAYERKAVPCIDCKFCKKNGYCRFRDLDDVVEKIQKNFLILVATPIYNGSFPAPLKAIFDRFQLFFYSENQSNNKKQAFLLATCGKRAQNTCSQMLVTQTIYTLNSINAELSQKLILDNMDENNRKNVNNFLLNKVLKNFLNGNIQN